MSPRLPTHHPRALACALAVALLAALVAAPLAGADVLTPESGGGSPSAVKIDTLYKITLAIGAVIFVGVEGALVYSLVKHRFRRGRPEPDQIRGNTRLEVGWTLGAAAVLVVISVLTFAFLPGIRNPESSEASGLRAQTRGALAAIDQPAPSGGSRLTVNVVGQQYLWRHDYQGGEKVFSYYELVVPVDTTVLLNVTASDVIHSYWVPKLFGKVDAVPGQTNRTWFKASEPGLYDGQCAELCGENHAEMRNRVRVLPVNEFLAWRARQAKAIRESHALLSLSRRIGQGEGSSPEATAR